MLFYYRMIKLGLAVLVIFAMGGYLVYDPLKQKGLRGVEFGDLYPGICAVVAGCGLVGLLWFMSRVPKDESQPEDNLNGPNRS